MNGSEVVTRRPPQDPMNLDGGPKELSDGEKMDLMAGDDTPYANAIKKLMRFEIVKARDEAMECPPEEEAKQKALMTVAHAMQKFYKNILGAIIFEKTKHLSDVKLRQAEEEMKDREKVEEIIFKNQTT